MDSDSRADARQEPPRRQFLHRFVGGSFIALLGTYLAAIAAYLRPANSPSARVGGGLDAGPLGDLAVGDAKVIQAGEEPVLVVRTEAQQVAAVSAVCPHLGCIVRWDQGQQIVRCPCHGAEFDLRGNVLRGPAARPLTTVEASVRDGQIVLGEIA